MQTRQLILVKHAETLLTADVTAEHWPLTPEGRAQCPGLARKLLPLEVTEIISSTEPKAIETGQIVARELHLPFESALGLHEHDRSNVQLVARERFEEHMRQFFQMPHEVVYGRESADDAHTRFRAALIRLLREHPAGTLAVVTHGTVMALLLARANRRDPFALWLELASPSFAVVDAGTFALQDLVTAV